MTKRPVSITTCTEERVKRVVKELAAADDRTVSWLVERWILDRPEVKARLNGEKNG